jgi:hypothetical protein
MHLLNPLRQARHAKKATSAHFQIPFFLLHGLGHYDLKVLFGLVVYLLVGLSAKDESYYNSTRRNRTLSVRELSQEMSRYSARTVLCQHGEPLNGPPRTGLAARVLIALN